MAVCFNYFLNIAICFTWTIEVMDNSLSCFFDVRLFINLLDKCSKRFVQPVVEPAAKCKRTLSMGTLHARDRLLGASVPKRKALNHDGRLYLSERSYCYNNAVYVFHRGQKDTIYMYAHYVRPN